MSSPSPDRRLRAADLADGECRRLKIDGEETDGEEIVVVRRGEKIYALAGRCPHSGGPLALGKVEDSEIVCPWHGARFHLADGRCTFGPSSDLRIYSVEIDGEEIVVRV